MAIKARNYGIFGLDFVGYGDIDCIDSEKIAIDELGEFFKYNFGVVLDSFTMTID
jgi:hypothetical protein